MGADTSVGRRLLIENVRIFDGVSEHLSDGHVLIEGRTIAEGMRMLIVPGSTQVRVQAEQEGLGAIFDAAGAEWRQAGCSMCLGMNPDQLAPGERCASTSNRNFVGRAGEKSSKLYLGSAYSVAAAAITGEITDPREFL